MKRSVTVQIAGQRFSLRSDAEDKTVQDIAASVDARLRDIQKSGRSYDTQQMAILAALQFAEELHRERVATQNLKKSIRDKSRALLSMLERQAGV